MYNDLPENYYNDDPNEIFNPKTHNMGLINDPKYCYNVDMNNINDPSNVLGKINFFTDYNADGLARGLVMKKMGIDVMPDYVSKDMEKQL